MADFYNKFYLPRNPVNGCKYFDKEIDRLKTLPSIKTRKQNLMNFRVLLKGVNVESDNIEL